MLLNSVHGKKKCSQSNHIIILCAVGQCHAKNIMFTEQSYVACALGQCSCEEKMFTEQFYIVCDVG